MRAAAAMMPRCHAADAMLDDAMPSLRLRHADISLFSAAAAYAAMMHTATSLLPPYATMPCCHADIATFIAAPQDYA